MLGGAEVPVGGQPDVRASIGRWLETSRVRTTIQAIIIFNALILGLETSETIRSAAGPLLKVLDSLCLAVFVVELALKIYVEQRRFLRSGWNVFDLVIVLISVAPVVGANLSVLRALRVLRLLRAISIAPQLRLVVEAMVRALPGLGSVFLLLGVVFYVGSVIAVQLFGSEFPKLFGTLGDAAFSLFTVMTLEGWPDVARAVMEVYPNAWIFFVVFILSTSFCALNLLVGLIVNAMQDAHEEASKQKTDAYQDEALSMLRTISARLDALERERT